MPASLPTVLLRHTTRDQTHYDWLLADPHNPQGPLWTARTAHASDVWPKLPAWELAPIAPHRRLYLTYEGPIANDRGEVQRVDEGVFSPQLWTPSRAIIKLTMKRCEGRLQLQAVSPILWRAQWV